ncbi:MalY/PatB family protein [Butyrivibrio sp. VCD2006]|uniref:MalY/PatB family protein n=1 Tax=Butyrivibrio sp. VCD2006 TaxID=1280664 RepID=UPI0003FEF940|nr:MalY/PatB family protein [Butyrivibrio sp. VCD2006]
MANDVLKKYNFDEEIDRRGTSSLKYDFGVERKGRDDLLPLWVADMDFKLPDEILEDLEKRVRHGVFGYTDPKQDYKNALKNWFKNRHGFEIEEEWNVITPGVVYAIAVAVRAFTEPGDSIIAQEPVYYPFRETVELNGRKFINNQLVYKNGYYEIDFEDFEEKIKSNNVKLFLLCSPHNPVGRVWTKEELTKIGDICNRYGVIVFADEIHSDFIYKGYKHTSYMELGDKYIKNLVLGTSPSKSFNIAGLQIANIIIPNEKIRYRFKRENSAGGYSQANIMGLTATISVYEKGADWMDELNDYIQDNLDFARDFLKKNLPEIKLIEPEGTYLIWLDFSEVTTDRRELAKLIVEEAKLWLDPGIVFSRQTDLFERINIACTRKTLEKALLQLKDAIEKRKGKI